MSATSARNKAQPVRISRAELAHLPRICEIERLCFEDPLSVAAYSKEFADGLAHYFVAEESCGNTDNIIGDTDNAIGAADAAALITDTVIGYCGYWQILDEGHVMNVAVEPASRGRGVGAGLVRAMLDDMRERGLRAATLEAREDNDTAIRLYGRFGFTRSGVRKNYYATAHGRKNAMIMWKYFL